MQDEADILGDRIAIISEGRLRCSGAPLFLKTRFGAGYELTISKDKNFKGGANESAGTPLPLPLPLPSHSECENDYMEARSTDQMDKGMTSKDSMYRSTPGHDKSAVDTAILDMVQFSVPDAKLASSVAGEMVIKLPITAAPLFGELFQNLKASARSLGVTSYGVCITTLEQVFIQLARESHVAREEQGHDDDASDGWQERNLLNWLQGRFSVVLGVFGYRGLRVSQQVPSDHPNEVAGLATAVNLPAIENDDGQIEMRGMRGKQSEGNHGEAMSPVATNISQIEHVSQRPQQHPDGEAYVYHDLEPEQTAVQWDSTKLFEKISIQLWELLHKRFIIAKRDLSGIFFQIVLPVIQIALVLAILTISLNPAGSTLTLNAGMFPVQPAALRAGSDQSYIRNHLSDTRMRLVDINLNSSQQASR